MSAVILHSQQITRSMTKPDTNIFSILSAIVEMIETLHSKIDSLSTPTDNVEKNWMNVEELQKYLPSHPKRQTIYSWTSARQIPFHKKGRSIMFDKTEIDEWLMDSQHIRSESNLEREAMEFINSKRIKR